jgi:hypothetical protein
MAGAEHRHVPAALDELAAERRTLRAEQDAFSDFRARLGALEVVRPAPAGSAGTQAVALTAPEPAGDLEPAREAYRETVMAVSHYAEQYGESLATNMAQELGPTLARAVVSDQPLSPPLKEALLAATREARLDRQSVIAALDGETEALRDAESRLDALERRRRGVLDRPLLQCSYDGLIARWRRLGDLAEDCARLCRERQSQLDGARLRSSDADPDSIGVYVYRHLPVDHPVLADALAVLARTEENRRRARWLLARLD